MSEKTAEQKLHEKLFKARKEAQAVAKNGHDGEQNFEFSRFEDVFAEGKRLLEKHRLLCIPQLVSEELHAGQRGYLAKVVIEYKVIDLTGGGTLAMRWSGTGADAPGDKAIFKAQTGCAKYFLKELLGIPFGTDPETLEEGADPFESPHAQRVRAEQDRAAEAPQVEPRRTRPLPTSDLPAPDWSGLNGERKEVSANA